ncbi:MAG: TIGR01841 family phasin [Pseudomonadota bacterium]
MADKPQLLDMFKSFGENLNIPSPDLNKVMDEHRKNLAALQAATSVSTTSAQEVLEKQRDALQQTLSEIADTVQNASKGGETGQLMAAPADLAKRSFDNAMKHMADVAQTVQKGNMDVMNILKDRLTESMEDLTGGQKKD